MGELTKRERVIRALKNEEVDKIPTYDIIHNLDLVEHVTGKKITHKNAADVFCQGIGKVLDVTRHLSIPPDLEPYRYKDADGFVYDVQWWIKSIIERPFETMDDVYRMAEIDIERICDCTTEKKVCRQALTHLRLFGEDHEYLEEVKEDFIKYQNLMDGTVMIAPESVPGIYTAIARYGIDWWCYLFHDNRDLALKLLDAILDYELCRIDSFADTKITPVSYSSDPIATNNSLLWSEGFITDIILPRTKKIVDKWKSYGYYHILYFEGAKLPILDKIIPIWEVDAIDPVEPEAGITVKEVRERYPDITICQPVDSEKLLLFGTEEEVVEATKKAIEDSGGIGIIIGASSEIHPKIPYKNALAMYDTAHSYDLSKLYR